MLFKYLFFFLTEVNVVSESDNRVVSEGNDYDDRRSGVSGKNGSGFSRGVQ